MKLLQYSALCLVLLTAYSPSVLALVDENACVPNVVSQLSQLGSQGNRLAVRVAGQMPGRAFTQAPVAVFGYENHLQGIQRLHEKPYVIVSGGDWWHRHGYVFVIKLGTKEFSGDRPFGTNVSRIIPPSADRMVKRLDIGDSLHWHPGGLGSSGDIVAVTAEEFMKTNLGKVFFFDFSDPENPKPFLNATLDRGTGKAGTVDLFKQPDGHYVVFVYTGGMLYFDRSKTTNIADGFDFASETSVAFDGGGSSVNVVKQCDGQLFLLSFDNTAHIAPIEKGLDQGYLYQLSFGSGANGIQNPKVKAVMTQNFNCNGYCNFGGAAGSFVSDEGKLSVYSSNFYRNYWGTKLKFEEFSN